MRNSGNNGFIQVGFFRRLKAYATAESGVEVVEYVALAGTLTVLIAGVWLYMQSMGGQTILAAVRDILTMTVGGFQQGW